jgi:two-component system, cell cycle sensor histidine kinase and response regulator CckA
MMLRNKTLLIICLTLAGLIGVLYGLSRVVLLRNFSRFEIADTQHSLDRAISAIANDVNSLDEIAADYSAWDSSRRFVEGKYPAYSDAEFPPQTFERARLSLLVVMDGRNRVLIERAYDLLEHRETPPPPGLREQLNASSPLVQRRDPRGRTVGILMLAEGPYLISSRPILTTLGQGPPRGTLMLGRRLNNDEVSRLAKVTHLDLLLGGLQDRDLPPDLLMARQRLQDSAPVLIQPLSDNAIAGYQFLRDVRQRPVLILRAKMVRRVYHQGEQSLLQFLTMFAGVGLAFGAIFLLLLERMVLSRVSGLSGSVSLIGSRGDLAARVPASGNDELAHLGFAINGMLEALERSHAERHEQQSRLQLLVEQIPGVLWTTDRELRFTSSLGIGLAAIGMKANQVIGQDLYKYFGTSDPEFPPIAAHRRALDGKTVTFETTWTEHTFHVHVEPLHNQGGAVVGTIGIALDVTDSRIAEEALRESEARKGAILESALDCIICMDHQGRVTEFNPAAERTFGIPRAEILGRELASKIIPARQRDKHRAAMARYMNSGVGEALGERIETTGLRADGSEFPLELAVTRIGTTDPPSFTAYVRDITARKRSEQALRDSEEALRNSEERFRSLVQNSSDIMTVLDGEGVIQYESPSISRILGYRPEELIGKSILSFLHPDEEALVADLLRDEAGATNNIVRRVEARFRHKDGSWRTLECIGNNLLQHPDVGGIVVNSRDITERKHLEQQLLQSQKMEAVGRLAGGIAHDFNNLLTVINGQAEVQMHRSPRDSPAHRAAAEIQQAGTRAAALVKQLLAFSRRQMLCPTVLDLNAAMVDIGKMLPRLIGEDIDLVMMLDPKVERVKVDPVQIEQIVMNLAVNARDAMPRGGKLVIETSNAELDEAFCQQHAGARVGKFAMLSVSDSGEGMDPETQAHIFEPFFTTKGKGRGTGLGLATVYGIVKQSEGYIQVESALQCGAVFRIYFPAVEGQSQPAVQPQAARVTPGGKETILLAEDEEPVRMMVQEFLQSHGYTVLRAADGLEALGICEQYSEPIHLLLTDVVMPRMGGRELAERMALLRPDLPILYISGYTDDVAVRHGAADRKAAFLSKPFTLQSLALKLREVLEANVMRRAAGAHG